MTDAASRLNSDDLTTLYIVRHGESYDNAGIPYPPTPEGSPLTDRGREQAQEVARRLAHVHADTVIASDLLRARQTAEIIARQCGLEVRIIPELHERSIGSFSGRSNLRDLPELKELWEAYDRGTDADRMKWKLGDDWESLDEALHRFVGGLERVVDDYPHKTAIVVAHGTVMRAFLIDSGYGTLTELRDGAVDNTGYIVVKTDGRNWTIVDTHGIHRLEPAAAVRGKEE